MEPRVGYWSLRRDERQFGVWAGYLGDGRTISISISARLSKSSSLTRTPPLGCDYRNGLKNIAKTQLEGPGRTKTGAAPAGWS